MAKQIGMGNKKNVVKKATRQRIPKIIDEQTKGVYFQIRPTELEQLENLVTKAKRDWRRMNNSMLVRTLIRIFTSIEVDLAEIYSEKALEDRIRTALFD